MQDDQYSLPSDVVAVVGSSASGGRKRKLKKSLPRVFFGLSNEDGMIRWAFQIVSCFRMRSAPTLHWHCDRVVALADPQVLAKSDVAWWPTLVHLKPEREFALRSQPTVVGGTLSDHFTDFAFDR